MEEVKGNEELLEQSWNSWKPVNEEWNRLYALSEYREHTPEEAAEFAACIKRLEVEEAKLSAAQKAYKGL